MRQNTGQPCGHISQMLNKQKAGHFSTSGRHIFYHASFCLLPTIIKAPAFTV